MRAEPPIKVRRAGEPQIFYREFLWLPCGKTFNRPRRFSRSFVSAVYREPGARHRLRVRALAIRWQIEQTIGHALQGIVFEGRAVSELQAVPGLFKLTTCHAP
jgi:hypothetical protein